VLRAYRLQRWEKKVIESKVADFDPPQQFTHAPYHAIQPRIKSEPVDSRYMLNMPYTLPPLPTPQLSRPHQSVISFPAGAIPIQPSRSYVAPRIPQADGPSEDDSPSPPAFAPRSSHPSLPQPQSRAQPAAVPEEEAINSDLDDSDSENEKDAEDGNVAESDIVFCTYDKVPFCSPSCLYIQSL
jgi:transcription initiation factor TFIIA large subunit